MWGEDLVCCGVFDGGRMAPDDGNGAFFAAAAFFCEGSHPGPLEPSNEIQTVRSIVFQSRGTHHLRMHTQTLK